ncbi:Protein of unknown function DUF247, plant [Dillenia turbinata]|uniref:Uncharacterized protein n=1 Tax=Dillenia turbinata TaxID=194707 RepID=A0AAN8UK50_9MAGN
MDDGSKSLIRNLVAFEQCHHPPGDYYLSNYISFIKCLAKTPKDVDLLVQNEIIVNLLGDNEAVSDLLHSACENIMTTPSMFYYSRLCEELIAYCKKPWNSYKTTLKCDYFKTPWMTATTIAAMVTELDANLQAYGLMLKAFQFAISHSLISIEALFVYLKIYAFTFSAVTVGQIEEIDREEKGEIEKPERDGTM